MSMHHYDLVWIQWVDAEHEGAWSTPGLESEYEIVPCESVGWLIHSNKNRLFIGSSTAMDRDDVIIEIGNKQIIPRGMIKKMKVLKRKIKKTKE